MSIRSSTFDGISAKGSSNVMACRSSQKASLTTINLTMSDTFAVIMPAAGSSSRYGKNKLLEPLAGQAVIERSLRAFLSRGDVAAAVLAVSDKSAIRAAIGPLADDPRVHLVAGGSCRARSVEAAVAAVPADVEWVAVHDAARPLVSQGLIDRVFAAAVLYGAAAPALPVHLTVKEAVGPLPSQVIRTLPRSSLWAMQTPQIGRRADLLAAIAMCPVPLEDVTDDLQLLELAKRPVWLVDGEERNLKLTTPMDLEIAGRWLSQVD
jgi:2-C-methyl-D-erythritol 4-phosphate cytidylyltransferase